MKSLLKSLEILEAVSQHQPASVGELSRLLDMPKSSVQRALMTFYESGWLRQTGGDLTRWEVSTRILAVRPAELSGGALYAAARDPMRELCDLTNETIHLSIPEGTKAVVLIDRIDCNHTVRTVSPIGDMSPIHATANGLAVLAHMSEREIKEVLSRELTKYSKSTPVTPRAVREAIAKVLERGFAVNIAQYRPGVCAIGSAILDANERPVGSICISMPEARYDPSRLTEWGDAVRRAAEQISAKHRRGLGPKSR